MKRQKDMTPEDEPHPPPRLQGVQYAIGQEWKTLTNSYSKAEAAGQKQERLSAVDVPAGESKA